MASIWQETLKLEPIGVFDNFFDIVRDSCLAMEVIERTRKAFAVNVSVSELFADPTVAGMAAAVMRSQCRERDTPVLVKRGLKSGPRDARAHPLLFKEK